MGLLIGVLTLAAMASIFIAALIVLWKHPPVIQVSFNVPETFTLIQQKLPAKIETDKPTEVPIPADILDYISKESDSWAQDARKRRVRAIYNDSNDWNYAFRQLQIEDGLND